MIVSFLGCPRSGKTTTAARVFSNLKEAGFITEFLPEQARQYIAEQKYKNASFELTDNDQVLIMSRQILLQRVLENHNPEMLVVTDSSPLNSLLYMSDSCRQSEEVVLLTKEALTFNTVYFKSLPVQWLGGSDPNRLHSQKQSEDIDKRIPALIEPLVGSVFELNGNTDARWRAATSKVLEVVAGGSC